MTYDFGATGHQSTSIFEFLHIFHTKCLKRTIHCRMLSVIPCCSGKVKGNAFWSWFFLWCLMVSWRPQSCPNFRLSEMSVYIHINGASDMDQWELKTHRSPAAPGWRAFCCSRNFGSQTPKKWNRGSRIRLSSMNDKKNQILITWKLLCRLWWNFYWGQSLWTGLRGWSRDVPTNPRWRTTGHRRRQDFEPGARRTCSQNQAAIINVYINKLENWSY